MCLDPRPVPPGCGVTPAEAFAQYFIGCVEIDATVEQPPDLAPRRKVKE
jgi:hypothetical protein